MTVHTPLRADDVRRSYARWAGHYDFTFAHFGRKYVKKVVNRLNDETHGRNVLDVGTGTGQSLPYFRPDLSITGIDISEDMLARAEQRAKRKKLKISPRCASWMQAICNLTMGNSIASSLHL